MMFKIFSSKYYSSNHTNKPQSELISLMTEPLSGDTNGQFSSIPIMNNEEIVGNEEDKHETGNLQVCRICYSTSDLQSLINPCECSGTMGRLHRNCLERWLEISNTTKCEICQHEFEVIKYPKSLVYFLTNPLRPSDIRYLINDIILFIFLTTIISWLSIISISRIRTIKTLYDGISYMILPLCVFFIYIIWCWVSFRYHIQVMKEWRAVNQLIHVINKKEMIPSDDHSPLLTSQNEENIIPDIHIIK